MMRLQPRRTPLRPRSPPSPPRRPLPNSATNPPSFTAASRQHFLSPSTPADTDPHAWLHFGSGGLLRASQGLFFLLSGRQMPAGRQVGEKEWEKRRRAFGVQGAFTGGRWHLRNAKRGRDDHPSPFTYHPQPSPTPHPPPYGPIPTPSSSARTPLYSPSESSMTTSISFPPFLSHRPRPERTQHYNLQLSSPRQVNSS